MPAYPQAFVTAFTITVGLEGGYVDDPNDPGGKTKYGISQRAYPTLDIPNLTLATAQAIYWTDYWLKARCDVMPGRLAVFVFDSAVNNGVGGAVCLLQKALSTKIDSVFGPGTLATLQSAVASSTGQDNVCAEFLARRMVLMAALPSWASQGLGWARRLCKLPFLTQGLTA